MSAATQTPGDRACRYAWCAEAVLRSFATQTPTASDLHWGLHEVAEGAAEALCSAIESAEADAIQGASCRYARVLAIVSNAAGGADEEMLLAAEALLEATKDMIDAETDRLMAQETQA